MTSPTIDTAPPMARPIVKPTQPLKQKQERPKRRTTKRAKWDDKEESKSVWFPMESEDGKRLEICLPGVKGVKESAFWWIELFTVRPR